MLVPSPPSEPPASTLPSLDETADLSSDDLVPVPPVRAMQWDVVIKTPWSATRPTTARNIVMPPAAAIRAPTEEGAATAREIGSRSGKSSCLACVSPCHHGRQRSCCKACARRDLCQHGQKRSGCKECGGVYQYGQIRMCKECTQAQQALPGPHQSGKRS